MSDKYRTILNEGMAEIIEKKWFELASYTKKKQLILKILMEIS